MNDPASPAVDGDAVAARASGEASGDAVGTADRAGSVGRDGTVAGAPEDVGATGERVGSAALGAHATEDASTMDARSQRREGSGRVKTMLSNSNVIRWFGVRGGVALPLKEVGGMAGVWQVSGHFLAGAVASRLRSPPAND